MKIENTWRIDSRINELKETKHLRYDGYLYLPQLYLLLPPPLLKYVYIHGFGKEYCTGLSGLLHGVANRECAQDFHQQDITPDSSKYI